MRKKLFSLLLLGLLCSMGNAWGTVIYETDFLTSITNATLTTNQGSFVTSDLPNYAGSYTAAWSNGSSTNKITYTFSTAIDLSDYTDVTITVYYGSGSNRPCKVGINSSSTSEIGTTKNNTGKLLNSSTSISAESISSLTFQSASGSGMYMFHFIIEGTPAATPPTYASSVPAKSATGVTINVVPAITYSKNLTLEDASKITMKDASDNPVTLSSKTVNNKVLTITPSSSLSYNTGYTITIAAGALSDGTTATTEADVISFTTGTAPSVTSISPNGGAQNGNTDVSISGNGTLYYQWSENNTAAIGAGSWTAGTSTTVPNVSGDRYLHVYASNAGGNSAITTSTKFEISLVKSDAELAYATTAVTKTLGDAAFTNELTNPHERTIEYSITNNGTGSTINSSTGAVTLGSAAGEETITATFAGDDDYLEDEVTYTLTINKKAHGLAYATSSVTKEIGDDNFTNVLTNPNSLSVSYSIVDGATATGVEVDSDGEVTIGSVAGTATIKASFTGNDEYNAGETTYTLTVNKKANGLAYASSSVSKEAGDDNFTNALTNPNSLSVSYSITSRGTGSTINSSTGEVTVGSSSGNETITATFSGNDTYKNGSVTYVLVIGGHSQSAVSTATTWDWTTFGYDKNASVKLDDNTIPSKNTEFNFADLDGAVYSIDAKIPVSFNAQALKIVAEYPIRDQNNSEFFQGTSVMIKTSVPGTLRVLFSNTGNREDSGANRRYLYVNNVNTGVYSLVSQSFETVDVILPSTGEVLINAYTGEATPKSTMIRIQKIIFTPVNSVSGTISSIGWNSFASAYPLDLSTLSFSDETTGTAYYASAKNVENRIITLSPCTTTVAAGKGLLINGTPGKTFTINTAASGDALNGNLLVGVTANATSVSSPYVLAGAENGKPYFQQYSGSTMNAGSAYLPSDVMTSAAGRIRFIIEEENNTTDIETLQKEEKVVKFFENGQLYIMREGVVYDALGRTIR